jgi:hypothetical protein
MPRAEPYRPMAKSAPRVNDRSASPLLRPRVVTPDVADPYNPGNQIETTSRRSDHLGSLHGHRHIDDAQYEAGRTYQRDWEVAERSLQAFDPSREYVSGRLAPDPFTDTQRRAQARLTSAAGAMGLDGTSIIRDVLIDGLCMGAVALKRAGLYETSGHFKLSGSGDTPTEIARNRFGRAPIIKLGVILSSALECLAIHYGLATRHWDSRAWN